MAERSCINFVIQGSAADICKIAMVQISQTLHANPQIRACMVLPIHDEIIFGLWQTTRALVFLILEIIVFTDVREDDVSVLEQLVIDAMEKSMRLRVPLVVHVSHGQRWGKLDAPSGDSKDDQPDTIHSDE